MNQQNLQIKCTKCGKTYEAESYKGIKCQFCGAPLKMVAVVKDEIDVEGMIDTVFIDAIDKENGKKKRDYKVVEGMYGAEYCESRDKCIHKERLIDRVNDKYYEKVVDPDNNEVMRYCEESLTEHYGHGSDRSRHT